MWETDTQFLEEMERDKEELEDMKKEIKNLEYYPNKPTESFFEVIARQSPHMMLQNLKRPPKEVIERLNKPIESLNRHTTDDQIKQNINTASPSENPPLENPMANWWNYPPEEDPLNWLDDNLLENTIWSRNPLENLPENPLENLPENPLENLPENPLENPLENRRQQNLPELDDDYNWRQQNLPESDDDYNWLQQNLTESQDGDHNYYNNAK